jgi:hypothetical protein
VQLDGFEQEQEQDEKLDNVDATEAPPQRKRPPRILWKEHPTNPELQWDKRTGKTRPAETVRIYTFGLPLGPTENGHLVDEQMRLAAKYRNNRTAILLDGRKEYRALVGDIPDLKALDDQIKALLEEREQVDAVSKQANIVARRRGADPDAKAKKAKLSTQIKKLRDAKKEVKKAISDPVILAKIAENNDRVRIAGNTANTAAGAEGTYWGTRAFVDRIAKQQQRLKGTDPKFRRYDGSGVIAVRVQGKVLKAEDLYAQTDTEVRIDRTLRRRFTQKHPEGVEIPNSCTLRFRVASLEGKPVWATFPMLLDERGLPGDGEINEIRIHRRREGARLKWEAQFSVSLLSALVVKPRSDNNDFSVGIDVGWSIVRDGDARCAIHRITRDGIEVDRCGQHSQLRIGFCAGSGGGIEPILLDPDIECGLSYANSIRSQRDKMFGRSKPSKITDESGNEAEVDVDLVPEPGQPPTILQLMREWCTGRDLPEALKIALKDIGKWRSSAHMQKAYKVWLNILVPGDEAIFPALRNWADRDRHLYQIESGARSKALRRRREFYRIWCKSLVSEYHTVFIEDFDLAVAAKGKIAGGARTVAAIHEFREVLKLAAANAGARVIKVDKNGTSRTCSDCGGRIEWTDQENYHDPTCTGCGRKWDRDHNAAVNILDRGLASGSDGTESTGTAR